MPPTYRPTPGPISETTQTNLRHNHTWQDWTHPPWHPSHWSLPDHGPRRSAPAEYPYVDWSPQHGWHRPTPRGPVRIPGFRSRKAWVRPVDGKRRGWGGRLRDVLTGEGPDVFVWLGGDRRVRGAPGRGVWTGWGEDGGWVWEAPWVRGRREGRRYNFFSRRYEGEGEREGSRRAGRLWRDARWGVGREGVRRGDVWPECVRGEGGGWVTRVPGWAGRFAGGRPYGLE